MDERTLTALKGSILKWEAIVAGTGTDDGAANCPLCQLFHPSPSSEIKRGHDCAGCPVQDATGLSHCEGSPYDEWAHEDRHEPEDAEAELKFLRSLLPAETAP